MKKYIELAAATKAAQEGADAEETVVHCDIAQLKDHVARVGKKVLPTPAKRQMCTGDVREMDDYSPFQN